MQDAIRQFYSRRRVAPLAVPVLVGIPSVTLAIFLFRTAFYSGFAPSDMMTHTSYIHLFLDSFRHRSLGLDRWDAHESFGLPIFRVYQNLAHFLVAAVCWETGATDIVRAANRAMVICVVLQPIAFYFGARTMRLDRTVSVSAAWLALLVSSVSPLGHELKSYFDFGLFTQAAGVLFFIPALGAISQIFDPEAADANGRGGLRAGLLVGMTFLLHHFFGYMLFLYFGALAARAVLFDYRKWQWRTLGGKIAVFAVFFVVICAYQLLSILQDSSLMHQSPDHVRELWDGFGVQRIASWFVTGELMDHGRLPTLTLMTAAGILIGIRRRASRAERNVLLFFGLGVVFSSGRATFGGGLDFIPGVRFVHLSRCLAMVHLGGVLLGAIAVGHLLSWISLSWIHLKRFPGRILVVAVLGTLGWAVCSAAGDRIASLQKYQRDRERQGWADQFLDRRLFTSVDSALRIGSLGTYTPRSKSQPYVGEVPYYAVASWLGYRQFAYAEESMAYGSDAVYLFNPAIAPQYRLLNVTAVIARPGRPGAFPFLHKVYENSVLASFTTPAVGIWDVAGISRVETAKDEADYSRRLKLWLGDKKLADDRYPAIIPSRVARRWPTAVPLPSQPFPAGEWGRIVSSNPLRFNSSRAVLFANRADAYGVFRAGFHPRWQIRVNGKARAPLWIAPGIVAFGLDQGLNVVEIQFPEDAIRSLLFIVGMATLLFCVGVVLYDVWPLRTELTALRGGADRRVPSAAGGG